MRQSSCAGSPNFSKPHVTPKQALVNPTALSPYDDPETAHPHPWLIPGPYTPEARVVKMSGDVAEIVTEGDYRPACAG